MERCETHSGSADRMLRTVSRDGGIALRVMAGTALVAEAARRHATSPTASAALGRALMGATLLAASAKHEESVQLQFRGDGPLGSVVVTADAAGRARGYVAHPGAHPPPVDGQLDIASAVGRGILAVVRERAGNHQPYSGLVPLETGTVAQDLAHYLAESEQSQSAVALGVFLDGGSIQAAGGFLVQALPGAREEDVEQAEENVRGFPGPAEMIRDGLDVDQIADRLLSGLGSRPRHYSTPSFHCGCTRERVMRAITALGPEDLREAREGGEILEVCCRFCASRYSVEPSEFGPLIEES